MGTEQCAVVILLEFETVVKVNVDEVFGPRDISEASDYFTRSASGLPHLDFFCNDAI